MHNYYIMPHQDNSIQTKKVRNKIKTTLLRRTQILIRYWVITIYR